MREQGLEMAHHGEGIDVGRNAADAQLDDETINQRHGHVALRDLAQENTQRAPGQHRQELRGQKQRQQRAQ